jgi:signal transduction histidine kinase
MAEGLRLGNMGLCHFALGDYRQAIDLHTQALTIARDIGDRYGEANALDYLDRPGQRGAKTPYRGRGVFPRWRDEAARPVVHAGGMQLTAHQLVEDTAGSGAGDTACAAVIGMAWPGKAVAGAVAAGRRVGDRHAAQLAAAGGLTALAVVSGLQRHPTVDVRIAVLAAVAATAPLGAVRRHPAPALAVMLSAQAGMLLFGRLSWTAVLVLAWLFALALCPLLLSRAAAVAAVVAMEIVIAVGAFAPAGPNSTPWDATAAEAAVAVVAWGVGENLRAWRHARARQRAMASRVHALRDSDAASRARVELARELHDVVAHHVSLIAVKAATAPYTTTALPAAAAAALDEIAAEARTALAELRTVLGVLRAPGATLPDGPLHGLSDLPDLVAGHRRDGANVALSLDADRDRVPESVQLCVFRVVQEGLTNARRHAPGSRVRVGIHGGAGTLRVQVLDDGGPSQPGSAGEPEPGFGLRGISERVTALGGWVQAGRLPGGGFEVSAVIPLRTPAV